MKRKVIIVVLGFLLFVQIIAYNNIQKHNIEMLAQELIRTDTNLQELKKEKNELLNKFEQLKTTVESIPASLLIGFEDPETGFVEFLDFLHNPIIENLEGEISLREMQRFNAKPVPLHESRFNFQFKFLNTFEAEKFFNYLLLQKQFPLQVNDLRLKRNPSEKVKGDLSVALLIPAKMQLPLLAQKIVSQ